MTNVLTNTIDILIDKENIVEVEKGLQHFKCVYDIKEKEKVGLIGCNGAGKTSLFKIITGEYTPDDGACFISKNSRLGYMEQHTCSENRTVYGELVSVFDDLIETEHRLDEISALLLNNPKNHFCASAHS